MTRPLTRVLLTCLAVMAFWLVRPAPAHADPISSCNSTLTECNLYEGSLLDVGLANCCFIAGDWILIDPMTDEISDVLRFFNNFRNTGGGTGLGTQAFLYSDDEGNLPTTFSVNARRIMEGLPDANGDSVTSFTSNGTRYNVHSHEAAPVPEPATLGLLAVGLVAARCFWRRGPSAH